MVTARKITAVYLRVSTGQQSTRSQRPDLERWIAGESAAADAAQPDGEGRDG